MCHECHLLSHQVFLRLQDISLLTFFFNQNQNKSSPTSTETSTSLTSTTSFEGAETTNEIGQNKGEITKGTNVGSSTESYPDIYDAENNYYQVYDPEANMYYRIDPDSYEKGFYEQLVRIKDNNLLNF